MIKKKIKMILAEGAERLIDSQSKKANWLYNHYLEVFAYRYESGEKLLTYDELIADFNSLKEKKPFLKTVNSAVLENSLLSVVKSYEDFTNKIKEGSKTKPKYKSWKKDWWNLVYSEDNGFDFVDKDTFYLFFGKKMDYVSERLVTTGVLVKTEKELKGKPLQITVVKEGKNYYAIFSLEKEKTKKLDVEEITDKTSVIRYFDKQIKKVISKRDRCKRSSNRYEYLTKTINRLCKKKREKVKLCLYRTSDRNVFRNNINLLSSNLVGILRRARLSLKEISNGCIARGAWFPRYRFCE